METTSKEQKNTFMKLLFYEAQKFTQWWLWTILIGIGVLPLYGIYFQLKSGNGFGNDPMDIFYLTLFSLLIYGIIILFLVLELKTEIDVKEIRMRFVPFLRKRISWNEIKSANVIDYGFVGGWGIRLGTKYGTVYNTRGNKGLAIELKSGKKLVIGTQKEDELRRVVAEILKKNPDS